MEFLTWKFSMIEPNRRIRKAEQIAPSTYRTYPKRWVLIQQFLIFQKELKIPVQNISFRTATELKEWLLKKSSARAHVRWASATPVRLTFPSSSSALLGYRIFGTRMELLFPLPLGRGGIQD